MKQTLNSSRRAWMQPIEGRENHVNKMRDFFRYLGQIARHGIAIGLTSLGILGEVVRLSGKEVPVPRWVDIALLLVGIVWGGYGSFTSRDLRQRARPGWCALGSRSTNSTNLGPSLTYQNALPARSFGTLATAISTKRSVNS